MILLELAAQGVRGVAPAGGRATLRPGYNVVGLDGPALLRLIETLLHPGPRDAELLPRAAGGAAGAAVRAGLTLVGDDRVTWRLVRDYAAGCQLHRFDSQRRAFALVSQDLEEIGRVLNARVGVPARERRSALLTISGAELPSRQLAASAAPAPRPALDPEAARRRIAALEAELARARRAEELQAKVDALQSRRFAADEVLRAGAKLRESLERAEAARAELEPVAAAVAGLGDPEARLVAYEKAAAKRDEAVAKAAAEREGQAAAAPAVTPPWRRKEFWAGVGAGVVFLGLGVAGAIGGGDLRYAALLDVPAFGVSAWVALRWVGALEAEERAGRRRRLVDEWERKALETFERDSADVRAALGALGLGNVAELREALGRLTAAEAAVAECRERIAAWEATPEAREAHAERELVDAEIQALEARLAEAVGGFVREARTVEAELARLTAEAAAPPARPTPPPVAGGDPIRGAVMAAGAALGKSPAMALLGIQAKASQAVVALSQSRLQAIAADERGNAVVNSGNRSVPAATLPPLDRDLVWLALKLAFLEAALAAGGLAVVDDAFAGLPEGSRRIAARLLKAAARPGQLIHATTDPAFREAADHQA